MQVSRQRFCPRSTQVALGPQSASASQGSVQIPVLPCSLSRSPMQLSPGQASAPPRAHSCWKGWSSKAPVQMSPLLHLAWASAHSTSAVQASPLATEIMPASTLAGPASRLGSASPSPQAELRSRTSNRADLFMPGEIPQGLHQHLDLCHEPYRCAGSPFIFYSSWG